MHPLDTLIREHVVPAMKAAGFAKKGRTFRLAAPNGDHAIVEVDADAVDPEKHVFDVFFAMVLLSSWEWAYRDHPKAFTINSSGALARCPVVPPAAAARQPDAEDEYFRNQWAFVEPDTRDLCGRELAHVLIEETIPRMVRLLDRRTLLEETRTNLNDGLHRLSNARMSEILLRIDVDPVAEVAALIDKAGAEDDWPPFITWARERLARRAAGA
jgi:hypothetical protein